MKKSIKFVKSLDKKLLVDFASRLTECENKKPTIKEELDNCIALYFRDYQGGHYDFEQTIRFDDFSYRINYQPANISSAIVWMNYVSKNLPESLQQDYAEQCKKYLQENALPDDDYLEKE